MAFDRYLAKPLYDERMAAAASVIGHAGVGTIALALSHRKPLLVLPRLKRYHEVVSDHQVTAARKYETFGYVLAAYDVNEIPAKLQALKTFVPRIREVRPQDLARRIGAYLDTLVETGNTPNVQAVARHPGD
jgi:UDP-N-acetylglucosamine transferase subunit ALG13